MSGLESVIATNKTAFYVFDVATLKERVRFLKSSKTKNVEICYAVKANPFVAKEIDEDLNKFELCSPGEYEICKNLGIDSGKMVISGVYKTPSFIESLVADAEFEGIYTAESMEQYRLLCHLADKYNRKIEVLPRLTNSSQFGVNESEIEEIIGSLSEHKNIVCHGIQFFSGTQKSSTKKIRREIEHLDEFLTHLRDDLGYESQVLEYGGGFPVAYFDGEELDEETYLAEFAEIVNGMTYKTGITLELGRSIVASCGKYFTHIVDLKCNKGVNYALVDGGMHHIVYFGQQMAMKHPKMHVVGKDADPNGKEWTICGALCSMHDIIVKQMPLPKIAIGDVICFENAGAYCVMEGISLFLSRDLPAVYILQQNGEAVCVRETFETATLNTPNYNK